MFCIGTSLDASDVAEQDIPRVTLELCNLYQWAGLLDS
jgi:hypothetical protein